MSNREYQVFKGEEMMVPIFVLIGFFQIESIVRNHIMKMPDMTSICLFGLNMIIILFLCLQIRTRIIVEEKGLRVKNDGFIRDRFISWDEMTYCYLYTDYKTNEFIVVAKKELSSKQVRRIALFSVGIYGRKTIVIPVKNASVDLYPLKICITSKVKIIKQ